MTQAVASVEQVCSKDHTDALITHSHIAFIQVAWTLINLTHVTLVTNCRRIDF